MEVANGPGLDDHQYTVAGLRGYEAIYGRDFVSPGGRRTTTEILDAVEWSPGQSVLDVGCGLGGAAFMMALEHRATVFGIDLSRNMAEEAARRCAAYDLTDQVELVHGDILTYEPADDFDLVHSREVFLHIHDKPGLFAKLHDSLRPGGRLLFTDYSRGPDEPRGSFRSYVQEFGYDLRTMEEIVELINAAGFTDVVATDKTQQFIEIHQRELAELPTTDLGQADQDELRLGWLAKIDRAERGEQRWAWFQATR